MKKIAIYLLLVVMFPCVCLFSGCDLFNNNQTGNQVDENPQGLSFSLLDDNTYGVSVGTATQLSNITIPSTYLGKSVTKIIDEGFRECSNLKSIAIPNSVTSIGNIAFFGCSSLTSIVIPECVTSIGEYAFSYCNSLTNITIPNGITNIEKETFGNCNSLTSIAIPNSVKRIGSFAFYDCSSLTSIIIPNSVEIIDGHAFIGCGSLTIYCEATSQPNEWSYSWNFYWNTSNVPVYWYSSTQPTTSGNYWHYVNGVVTLW